MMIRRGAVMRCQFGLFGDKGYRKSVAVKVIDVKVGPKGIRTYLVRILGLCVIGIAHKPDVKRKDIDLFSATNRYVAYAGQFPSRPGIETESEALISLGYEFE